jgi:lysozyme
MNALGCDVSKWQPDFNWSVASARGIAFAFIKCTQGITTVDPYYAYNWRAARETDILTGAYHWYEPEIEPIRQLDYFTTALKSHALPPVVDLEDTQNITAAYRDNVHKFLVELEKCTGALPIIYTSSSYWELYFPHTLAPWAVEYPLWIANYRKDAGPLVPLPWAPTNWTFWQFTDKGHGPYYGTDPARSKQIDLDVYNGTVEELRAAYAAEGSGTE